MMMPSKVKYRKQQRGRMRGTAYRGSELSFGEYGLVALAPGWLTARQIEAGRVAIQRHSSPTSRSPRSRPRPAWARGRARPRAGSRS